MIRINLLPPEIIERRKYERYYPYVVVGAAVLVAVVLITWGVLSFLVASAESELQSYQQTASDLRVQAQGLAVFEMREQELAARQAVASEALAGRVDMGRLAEEVSLVLPDDVWAQTLACDEETGLQATLHAPDPLGSSVSDGFKAAASTLVRLSSLDLLYDVWMTQAQVTTFEDFQGVSIDAPSVQSLSFDITGKIGSGPSAEEPEQ